MMQPEYAKDIRRYNIIEGDKGILINIWKVLNITSHLENTN